MGGIDVFELPVSDIRPHANRLFGIASSGSRISSDAADESHIGHGDRGVIVDIELGLRCDVDFIFLIIGNLICHQGVESVDSFDDNRLILFKINLFSEFSLPGLKFVDWIFQSLSLNQS